MRILIVGSNKIYAIENIYQRKLEQLGMEVMIFTAQNYFYAYYQKSLLNKILYRAGLSGIIIKINKLFRKSVEDFKPKIIWIFKGMEITPATLLWVKRKKIKLVNYNPDNPFIFSGSGSGNTNVTKSIPLFDMHFTYNMEVKKKLEKMLSVSIVYLPFGFDLGDQLYKDCEEQEEIVKVCFAGNPDAKRATFIEKMAVAGIEIDVYGNNWAHFVKNHAIAIHPPVYGREFWMILRRYRVQLNLMRVHNENSHNMRSFEVPAIGGIMLAPDTPEHKLFFEDGKEVFLFSSIDRCVELANTILKLSGIEANKVRKNARERSLHSGYSYSDRAFTALQALKNLED
jgi:spore maturation protein CgeB